MKSFLFLSLIFSTAYCQIGITQLRTRETNTPFASLFFYPQESGTLINGTLNLPTGIYDFFVHEYADILDPSGSGLGPRYPVDLNLSIESNGAEVEVEYFSNSKPLEFIGRSFRIESNNETYARGAIGLKNDLANLQSIVEVDVTKYALGCIFYGTTTRPSAYGSAVFRDSPPGLQFSAKVYGLAPGQRAIHIHNYGDNRDGAGMNAELHLNPSGSPHGVDESQAHHSGDLGNLLVNSDGKGVLNDVDPSQYSMQYFPGRGCIVHENGDDGVTSTGARSAFGVVGYMPIDTCVDNYEYDAYVHRCYPCPSGTSKPYGPGLCSVEGEAVPVAVTGPEDSDSDLCDLGHLVAEGPLYECMCSDPDTASGFRCDKTPDTYLTLKAEVDLGELSGVDLSWAMYEYLARDLKLPADTAVYSAEKSATSSSTSAWTLGLRVYPFTRGSRVALTDFFQNNSTGLVTHLANKGITVTSFEVLDAYVYSDVVCEHGTAVKNDYYVAHCACPQGEGDGQGSGVGSAAGSGGGVPLHYGQQCESDTPQSYFSVSYAVEVPYLLFDGDVFRSLLSQAIDVSSDDVAYLAVNATTVPMHETHADQVVVTVQVWSGNSEAVRDAISDATYESLASNGFTLFEAKIIEVFSTETAAPECVDGTLVTNPADDVAYCECNAGSYGVTCAEQTEGGYVETVLTMDMGSDSQVSVGGVADWTHVTLADYLTCNVNDIVIIDIDTVSTSPSVVRTAEGSGVAVASRVYGADVATVEKKLNDKASLTSFFSDSGLTVTNIEISKVVAPEDTPSESETQSDPHDDDEHTEDGNGNGNGNDDDDDAEDATLSVGAFIGIGLGIGSLVGIGASVLILRSRRARILTSMNEKSVPLMMNKSSSASSVV